MIRKQSPRQKIRNWARYWDSDYLAGFIKGLKIRQEYEYRRGMRDLRKKISERYGLDDEWKYHGDGSWIRIEFSNKVGTTR